MRPTIHLLRELLYSCFYLSILLEWYKTLSTTVIHGLSIVLVISLHLSKVFQTSISVTLNSHLTYTSDFESGGFLTYFLS